MISQLTKYYHSYLESQDSARFIKVVSTSYDLATLVRIAECADVAGRRAAVLALCYLGDYSVNAVVGRCLADEDRGVRLIAESGIAEIWLSFGSVSQRHSLQFAERMIAANQLNYAAERVTRVLRFEPQFAEASRLQGVIHFSQGEMREARADFRQALLDNPYQYQAAIGLGNCCVRLGDDVGALRWFRRALRLNPELERIRLHVDQLTRQD